ncbi:DUF5009 domain-containing protein [bacterium]|nr:DUF5009 domain-containing protein [bacterium]
MSEAAAVAKPSAPRALALDALRGWAIIAMCISGVVPWGGLPSWMYHAQYAGTMGFPGLKYTATLPGYTWVDLVFPAFLFSMGAAFPFALSSRIAKGVAQWRILAGVFGRGACLVAFAIYVQHITPSTISNNPDAWVQLQALLGFALLFPMLVRMPDSFSKSTVAWIRGGGLVGAVLLMYWLRFPEGSLGTRFNLYRSNIILLVLSNMAVWGSIVWLWTRGNLVARLAVMAVVAAAIQADKVSGSWVNIVATPRLPAGVAAWCSEHLGFKDFTWAYQFMFVKYLLIVIPGTIVGDILLDWMKRSDRAEDHGRGTLPIGFLSVFCLLVIVGIHVGLHGRWVFATALTVIPLLGLVWYVIRSFPSQTKTDVLLKGLLGWGSFWLVLGLLCEPLEGGIKKDPSNASYYFVSTGLSILMLISFTIWIDLYKKQRWFWLLIANGQNPMLAYVAIRNLLAPIVGFPFGTFTLENWAFTKLAGNVPVGDVWRYWRMFIWSMTKTLALSWVVALFTRAKIIWRA